LFYFCSIFVYIFVSIFISTCARISIGVYIIIVACTSIIIRVSINVRRIDRRIIHVIVVECLLARIYVIVRVGRGIDVRVCIVTCRRIDVVVVVVVCAGSSVYVVVVVCIGTGTSVNIIIRTGRGRVDRGIVNIVIGIVVCVGRIYRTRRSTGVVGVYPCFRIIRLCGTS
jgi:hypothetical protein